MLTRCSLCACSVFTRCLLNTHSVLSRYLLNVHTMLTQCLHNAHSMLTQCSLDACTMLPQCSIDAHPLVVARFLLKAHSILTLFLLTGSVYSVLTGCSLTVHPPVITRCLRPDGRSVPTPSWSLERRGQVLSEERLASGLEVLSLSAAVGREGQEEQQDGTKGRGAEKEAPFDSLLASTSTSVSTTAYPKRSSTHQASCCHAL